MCCLPEVRARTIVRTAISDHRVRCANQLRLILMSGNSQSAVIEHPIPVLEQFRLALPLHFADPPCSRLFPHLLHERLPEQANPVLQPFAPVFQHRWPLKQRRGAHFHSVFLQQRGILRNSWIEPRADVFRFTHTKPSECPVKGFDQRLNVPFTAEFSHKPSAWFQCACNSPYDFFRFRNPVQHRVRENRIKLSVKFYLRCIYNLKLQGREFALRLCHHFCGPVDSKYLRTRPRYLRRQHARSATQVQNPFTRFRRQQVHQPLRLLINKRMLRVVLSCIPPIRYLCHGLARSVEIPLALSILTSHMPHYGAARSQPSALLPLPPNPKNLPPYLVSQFHRSRTEQQCENQCRRESLCIVSQQVLGKNEPDERTGQETADNSNRVLHTFLDQGGFCIAQGR